jgi:cuproxidase
MLTRRSFAASAGALATVALLDSRSSLGDITPSGGHLPIPQLIDAASQDNVIMLKVSSGHHAFYKGKPTRTLGYSAPILGPVLRLRRGHRVEMIVQNAMDVATTVHWHGLLVHGDSDGGPQQRIDPG